MGLKQPLLRLEGISRAFGGLMALNDVSFAVNQGELLGVIGPNGSGKTTLFNVLTGFLPPSGGRVWCGGEDITAFAPHQRVKRGIARTFQTVRFHKRSTVRETVWAAQTLHLPWRELFRGPAARAEQESERRDEIDSILEMTWLSDYGDKLASELPFGLVRQLEIARALATRPKIILMDEPASGMNPAETKKLASDIERLHASGITVVIVEHDIDMIMSISERIVVLNFGKKIAEGNAGEVRNDPEVIRAYLGNTESVHA